MSEVAFESGCNTVGNGVVICGPGGVVVQERWTCPECKAENARLLTRWPNSAYYGPMHSCECGDEFADGYRLERPFARGWRAKARAEFEKDWPDALPEGTQPNYTRDAWLQSVTLPDGQVVSR
jgi:hypothetical protein